MYRTFLVARREFVSTVMTKGFIIGVLMTPIILAVVAGGIALTQNLKGPKVIGSVAVIDRAGGVADGIVSRFSKEAVERDQRETAEKVADLAKDQAAKFGVPEEQVQAAPAVAAQAVRQSFEGADLSVEVLDPATDEAAAKQGLATVRLKSKAAAGDSERSRVALAIIPPGAVRPDESGAYARFDLFTAPKLDFEIQKRIENRISEAVIDARLNGDDRIRASGLSPDAVRALIRPPGAKATTVTAEGEKKNTGPLQMLIPMAFMLLLLMSVMTGGQYLLTSTVEEKSSRVMEVLLSAISPLQLMLGKIVGQMCVGLLMLVVYSGLGIVGLFVSARMHMLDPMMLVYMVIFFFIAFFIIASMMAAAGSAVSEMREAQTLMAPVMMIVMVPWLLWLPISRAPNSAFSTIMSFVPGINPFVMMLRLTSNEPPPTWQIPVSIGIGLATVVFCAWAAAKIFRIGVLLHGKPPNFKTLIKWARMA